MENKLTYKIWDYKTIKAFRKFLEDNKIKFRIEWLPCCIAVFHIDCEPGEKHQVQWGYYDVQWKIYG